MQMLPTVTGQLDVLYIYANGYSGSMSELVYEISKLSRNCTIKVIDPVFGAGDVQDMGKFWPISELLRGVIYLLDDDIMYPSDYCSRHDVNIAKHQCISTVHGRKLKCFPIGSYFGDTKSIHWRRSLEHDTPVHICGTGTVAFSTDQFRPELPKDEVLKNYIGMADIWFSCLARYHQVPIVSINRYENWLQHTLVSHETTSLYVKMKHNTKKHCECINRLKWEL